MSERKKVVVVAGTRPEVIKMSSIYMELKNSDFLEPVFLSTGQHREMLAQALGHLICHRITIWN